MIKKLLLTLQFAFVATFLLAQLNQTNHSVLQTIESCKTDQKHKNLYLNNAAYRQNFDNAQNSVRNIINSGIRGGGVYTIPVVVHVMHLGSAEGSNENISDAQIQSAIDNLNEAYSNAAQYNGLDIQIQFALAQRDPNCLPTDGINRINAANTIGGGDNYSTVGVTENNELTLKALSNWPNSDYYNIWVVTEIDNNGGGAGTQGYAYFPGAPNGMDGTIILYNSFGYDPTGSIGYNLKSYTRHNATTIHELGHGLDLYHTFEGDNEGASCPGTANCSTTGDECCDTDAHNRNDSDCQGGIDPTCNGVNGSTVFNNFMAYSSDACQDRFTADQKSRMRAAMEGPRLSLLNSKGDEPISGTEPGVAQSCQPQTTNLPNGFGIGIFEFTLADLIASSGSSDDDNGYLEKWCNNTTLDVSTQYNVSVTNRTGGNNEDVKVYIDYNNDGDFLDASEEIFSSNANTFHSGNFTTPASPTTNTPIWVRVISDFAGNTISGPCYTPEYGQVEDYSITISNGAPIAPVANFSANNTTVCQNANVTFTDASTNASTYNWNFGSGASPATATGIGPHNVSYSTAGTKTVTLDVTGPGGNDNETKTNYITVNSTVTPSVSIVASANPITSGDPVTFTATPTNGGTPSYQWKLNGGNVGSNSTTYNNSTLVNGDQVSCVMTSTANCASPTTATSNTVTMTVNPVGSCSTDIAGPGGVSNQTTTELWLDAGNITGVNNGAAITYWNDRSGNLNDAKQITVSNRPILNSTGLNNKPVVNFDGVNDYMSTKAITDLNTSNLSWFIIAESDNLNQIGFMLSSNYTSGSGAGSSHLWGSYTVSGTYRSFTRTSSSAIQFNDQGSNSGYQIISNIWNGSTDQLSGYVNGNGLPIKNGLNANPANHRFVRIGSRSDAPNLFFDGKIAEIIIYAQTLNEAQRVIVDNYLAAKYNLPLSSNDIFAFEATHNNDAAGIGMISGTSHTSAKGSIVELSNASTLANNDFIMFAHNGTATSPTTTGTPSAYGGTGEMMTRVWRADKTNDVGTVTVRFYLDGIATGSSTNFELLKDADGNFSNATRITAGFSYDAGCDIATWTGVNFTDGDYFTIGNPDGAALLVEPIMEMEANYEQDEKEEIGASALEIFDAFTDEIKMKLYPNPTTGSLTIENIVEGAAVEIYNSLGQLVYNSSILTGRNTHDFGYLNSGIYIVHLKDINNETISISQLMIQK